MKLVGDHASAPGRVDHKSGVQITLPAIRHLYADSNGAPILEKHSLSRHPLEHLGSELMGVAEEHRVENVALDVVCVGLLGVGRRELAQSNRYELAGGGAGGSPARPRLVHEAGILHLLEKPNPLEDRVGRGRDRFTDVVPRVDVLLHHQCPVAPHCQK